MDFENSSALTVTLLLTWASFGLAFSNVVIDAVLIIQARKDEELGSQDLLAVSFLTAGIASVTSCLIAALMMEKYHPKYAYLGYGIFGLFLGTACLFLSKKAERDFLPGEIPI